MKNVVGVALVILGLSFLLSFISSLDFSKTGLTGFIGAGPFQGHAGMGEHKWEETKFLPANLRISNECNLRKFSNPPQLPIYFVEGLNAYTNHMRLYTSSTYIDGVWKEDNVSYNDRQEITISPYLTRYKVTPIIPFEGHIPVSKDTCYVSIDAKFNRSTGTFIVKRCDRPYLAVSTAHGMNPKRADDKGFAKIEMNPAEYDAIRRLAMEITKGARNDYEKALMIERFLKRNYEYTPEYDLPPPNVDPVYWFLFKEKKGVCKEFASAFVIMCNAVGLPARLVVGYLAEPIPDNQTVFASQYHAWAEVKFKEGWVEFDPTPSARRIPTTTKITHVDEVVLAGKNFTVMGTVETKDGKPVSGYVEIYLKKRKDGKGILLKLVHFENGRFSVSVKAPDLVGKYHVVAHYVGSFAYLPSWSDPIVKILGMPRFDVKIPNRVSTNLTIRGRLVDYNGTGIPNAIVFVNVDGRIYEEVKTDSNGCFEVFIKLSRGEHDIELYYPGSKFILPVKYEKRVEAGEVDVVLLNSTVWAGKENEVLSAIFFNGKPLKNQSVRLIYGGKVVDLRTDGRGFVRFGIEPKNVGKIPLEFEVLGYGKLVFLKSIAGVKISADYENGVLKIKVEDQLGNKLSGRVVVNGKTYRLENGIANVRASGSKFVIYYPGDEFHPPAEVVYEKGFPLWILPLFCLIPIVYFFWRREGVEIVVETEIDGLPLIWKRGERIKFNVICKEPYKVFADGKPVKGNWVTFDDVGEHVLRVERDGKVREVKIKIVDDYGVAIAEIFNDFIRRIERKKGLNLKNATPREIIKLSNCNSKTLLRIFELYKYGNRRGFERKDFVEAFKEVSSCVRSA